MTLAVEFNRVIRAHANKDNIVNAGEVIQSLCTVLVVYLNAIPSQQKKEEALQAAIKFLQRGVRGRTQ